MRAACSSNARSPNSASTCRAVAHYALSSVDSSCLATPIAVNSTSVALRSSIRDGQGQRAGSSRADEAAYVAAARAKAFTLYEGVRMPHRSCGIAIAETSGCRRGPYQALRRGGITGKGACGAIRAGEQVLGELLGDPDPGGAVTPRAARRDRLVSRRVARPHPPRRARHHLRSPRAPPRRLRRPRAQGVLHQPRGRRRRAHRRGAVPILGGAPEIAEP